MGKSKRRLDDDGYRRVVAKEGAGSIHESTQPNRLVIA